MGQETFLVSHSSNNKDQGSHCWLYLSCVWGQQWVQWCVRGREETAAMDDVYKAAVSKDITKCDTLLYFSVWRNSHWFLKQVIGLCLLCFNNNKKVETYNKQPTVLHKNYKCMFDKVQRPVQLLNSKVTRGHAMQQYLVVLFFVWWIWVL